MRKGPYRKLDAPEWVDPVVDEMIRIMREDEWTWMQLVQASNVPISSLMNWRTGARNPSVAGIRKVLNALGYDLAVVKMEVEDDRE